MEMERAAYDAVMRQALALYQKDCSNPIQGRRGSIWRGAIESGGDRSASNQGEMRDLLRALEEKQRLMELLDRFLLEEMPGVVQVRVGLEEAHPAHEGASADWRHAGPSQRAHSEDSGASGQMAHGSTKG